MFRSFRSSLGSPSFMGNYPFQAVATEPNIPFGLTWWKALRLASELSF